MDDLKYEKENVINKVLNRFKKTNSQAYDEKLPDLSPGIASSNIINTDPMQPEKTNVAIPEIPSINPAPTQEANQVIEPKPAVQALPNLPNPKMPQPSIPSNPPNTTLPTNIPTNPLPSVENNLKKDLTELKPEKVESEEFAVPKNEKLTQREGENVFKTSVFDDILKHLESEQGFLHEKTDTSSKLLNKNILLEMKNHWTNKKEEISQELKNKDFDKRINSKITELQTLEGEWQSKEAAIEEYKKQLSFVENLIEEKSVELKRLIRDAKHSREAKNPFVLSNGKAVSSIKELSEVLAVIDYNVFSNHVNEVRNDFSEWVMHEFKDSALSNRIKDSYSKEDLIAILNMF